MFVSLLLPGGEHAKLLQSAVQSVFKLWQPFYQAWWNSCAFLCIFFTLLCLKHEIKTPTTTVFRIIMVSQGLHLWFEKCWKEVCRPDVCPLMHTVALSNQHLNFRVPHECWANLNCQRALKGPPESLTQSGDSCWSCLHTEIMSKIYKVSCKIQLVQKLLMFYRNMTTAL